MAHSYNDMPAFVHLFNDLGLIPLIVIFLTYLIFMIFLYKKGDNDSIKMMLVIAVLCLISSNPIAPANAGFYLVWMGIFSIMNKYKIKLHQNPINKVIV